MQREQPVKGTEGQQSTKTQLAEAGSKEKTHEPQDSKRQIIIIRKD